MMLSYYIQLMHLCAMKFLHQFSNHKEILWINISAPSLGDSLTDLSSRTMLSDRKVDLFTDKKNSDLYKDDFIFFINGQYMEHDALTIQQSGSQFLLQVDNDSIGYALESDDEIIGIGKFNS